MKPLAGRLGYGTAEVRRSVVSCPMRRRRSVIERRKRRREEGGGQEGAVLGNRQQFDINSVDSVLPLDRVFPDSVLPPVIPGECRLLVVGTVELCWPRIAPGVTKICKAGSAIASDVR